jgi:EVE domain
MRSNWIGVACADHVRRGRQSGVMQLCHGKASPLRRVRPGDVIAYYSPTHVFRGKDKLQAFTALGVVREGQPYAFDMGGGFCPFRRDVEWFETRDAPIAPLLDVLDFAAGRRNWGYQLRFGLFPIGDRDMELIAQAMGIALLPSALERAS